MSWTVAVPPDACAILPTRPSPVITASSRSTPSSVPLLIWIVEDQSVGERAITRPVTGFSPCGKPGSFWRSTIALSCSFSRCALRAWASSVRAWASSVRAWARSFFSFLFSLLASKASPTQLKRSRNGLNTLLAPDSIGDSTSWAPFWTPWSMPPGPSPK
jgi:hypothetical protein